MAHYEKFSKGVGVLLAVVVAVLTLTIMAHAVQTVSTPNSTQIAYNLAPGAFGAPITPVPGQPVLVMGVQNNVGNRGVGKVMMLRSGIAPLFLEWVGLESTAGAAITQGFSGVAGTHIVFLDFAHTVDIEVASADTFRVHNGGGAPASGKVTLIW